MFEILRNLPDGSRILDLGALNGSFSLECVPRCLVARIDREWPLRGCGNFVQGDAARLPFPDRAFDVVIASHSLEHIDPLDAALQEIGRVIRPGGSMYVAVPDASTLSDRLFRWLNNGGGHVNPFCSASELAQKLTQVSGLPLTAMRPLYSSFEYLNHYYFPKPRPWTLRLIGNGSRKSIILISYAARLFDRVFKTRASAYGWAFYFGEIGEPVETESWSNVCVGCGAGASASWLAYTARVRRHFLGIRSYRCERCGGLNLFTPDPLVPPRATQPSEPAKAYRLE